MKFQIGDEVEVLPRQLGDITKHPHFLDKMAKFVGKHFTVTEIFSEDKLSLNDSGYVWLADWLKLIKREGKEMTKIEELQQQLKDLQATADKLQKEIEAEKNNKWEPKGEGWLVSPYGVARASSDTEFCDFGIEFETQEKAEKAYKDYRRYHRLYKLAEELNNGWEPDRNNINQTKFYIMYDYTSTRYSFGYNESREVFNIVYFKNKETVETAIKMIENGALD